jgi:hypothetical protein
MDRVQSAMIFWGTSIDLDRLAHLPVANIGNIAGIRPVICLS